MPLPPGVGEDVDGTTTTTSSRPRCGPAEYEVEAAAALRRARPARPAGGTPPASIGTRTVATPPASVGTSTTPPTDAVRDAAATLRRRGLAVCRVPRGEKSPTASGWNTRSVEPPDLEDGDQIGIIGGPLSHGNRPGHALVVLDLDGRDAVERPPGTSRRRG